jgi:hypothetical protein
MDEKAHPCHGCGRLIEPSEFVKQITDLVVGALTEPSGGAELFHA